MDIQETAENYIPSDEKIEEENTINQGENVGSKNKILDIILSQTGSGNIESYSNHPLNIKSDKNISQLLRGLTGILGCLNFALIDILLGSMGFIKDRNSTIIYKDLEPVKEVDQNV